MIQKFKIIFHFDVAVGSKLADYICTRASYLNHDDVMILRFTPDIIRNYNLVTVTYNIIIYQFITFRYGFPKFNFFISLLAW